MVSVSAWIFVRIRYLQRSFFWIFLQDDREVIIMRLIVRILAPIFLVLGLIGPASAASAAPAITEKLFTTTFHINNCGATEEIEGEGTLQIIEKWQQDGSILVSIHLYGEGVGSTGNEYVFNHNARSFQTDPGATTFDAVERVVLVSKGPGLNQAMLLQTNQDGIVRFERDCTGQPVNRGPQ